MMKLICPFIFLLLSFSCTEKKKLPEGASLSEKVIIEKNQPYLIVLGTVQDAGSPQIDCKKPCCIKLFKEPDHTRKVVSLGLVDPIEKKTYLFEATPDISSQMSLLNESAGFKDSDIPEGIFITHAHIGHYTGLMYLGRESKGADSVPVYMMPRMKSFIENNGPWSQLVELNNIEIKDLNTENEIVLGNISVECFSVPHRDEFSETVGFKINGPKYSALFIPDIDKWSKWKQNIISLIDSVDYAFIDATFYNGDEIGGRDISLIPHPFVIESMELFKDLNKEQKSKIYFTHFNHTNPLLNRNSKEYKHVISEGFKISSFLDRVQL